MKTGPGGLRLPTAPHRSSMVPHMPAPSAMASLSSPHLADGGDPTFEGHALRIARGSCPGGVKCIVASGEYIIPNDEVERIEYKGLKGHPAIDAWILDMRGKTVKTLKNLSPPVGMKS